jgi:hypothetical protein
MTTPPDEPDERPDASRRGERLDEEAAWREIVANYGERPDLGEEPPAPPPPEPTPAPEPGLRGVFARRWEDPLDDEATWDDEGHFVPPDPPPVEVSDPRRRAAWAGLFGAPLVMLIAVVLGWQFPGWLMLGLVAAFVGGFVYLVATMPDRPPGDGDNGAVV